MKLKEFITKLSNMDPELEVLVYTEDPHKDLGDFKDVSLKNETDKIDRSNVEAIDGTLFIGG